MEVPEAGEAASKPIRCGLVIIDLIGGAEMVPKIYEAA